MKGSFDPNELLPTVLEGVIFFPHVASLFLGGAMPCFLELYRGPAQFPSTYFESIGKGLC